MLDGPKLQQIKDIFLILNPDELLIELQQSLARQSELSKSLEENNENLERRVTERTNELKEREEQYRAFFDNSGVAVCLFGLNSEFLRVNSAWAEMLG